MVARKAGGGEIRQVYKTAVSPPKPRTPKTRSEKRAARGRYVRHTCITHDIRLACNVYVVRIPAKQLEKEKKEGNKKKKTTKRLVVTYM